MYRGWRIAAIIVLVITAISWFFFRNQAGFIGGGAWFALLFIPAVGLRKLTELFAQRRYRAARRLAIVLQIFHPSAELRRQIGLLRSLESQPQHASYSWPNEDQRRRLRRAPAVLVLIALNSCLSNRDRARRYDSRTASTRRARFQFRSVSTRVLAIGYLAVSALRRGAPAFQSPCALCSWPGFGASNRHVPIQFLLPCRRTWLDRRRRCFDLSSSYSTRRCGWRVRCRDGNRRSVGRIPTSPSTRTESQATSP
jgi:hypothetical protein